jgi:antitoxin (DNA-binding transcriptional repressor) of toxin-antitoxin stability system
MGVCYHAGCSAIRLDLRRQTQIGQSDLAVFRASRRLPVHQGECLRGSTRLILPGPEASFSEAYTEIDGDTVLVSVSGMTSITSKELHEQTGALLDRVKQGQRFRVLRGGEADALLVPATDQIDPPWDEIMAEVRKARAQGKAPRPNPILAERRKRHHAAGLRR